MANYDGWWMIGECFVTGWWMVDEHLLSRLSSFSSRFWSILVGRVQDRPGNQRLKLPSFRFPAAYGDQGLILAGSTKSTLQIGVLLSMCFNMFQYVSILFNTILFNTQQKSCNSLAESCLQCLHIDVSRFTPDMLKPRPRLAHTHWNAGRIERKSMRLPDSPCISRRKWQPHFSKKGYVWMWDKSRNALEVPSRSSFSFWYPLFPHVAHHVAPHRTVSLCTILCSLLGVCHGDLRLLRRSKEPSSHASAALQPLRAGRSSQEGVYIYILFLRAVSPCDTAHMLQSTCI